MLFKYYYILCGIDKIDGITTYYISCLLNPA